MGLYEGIKDVAKIVQQADNIKLYQQLLDLCAQALELQSEVNRLTNENDDLRKKQDIESKIVRYDGLFVTLGNDTSVVYCSHCWDSERKLIQLDVDMGYILFVLIVRLRVIVVLNVRKGLYYNIEKFPR